MCPAGAMGSGEVALNRAFRVVDGMHVDVVLLGIQQDVDENPPRRCDAVARLVGVHGALDRAELGLEVDGDRAALGVGVDVGISDPRGWFGRLANAGDGDVIADRLVA